MGVSVTTEQREDKDVEDSAYHATTTTALLVSQTRGVSSCH